ncbi:hypothetical protein [Spirillospora sp. NBC_01491]|uniref:hypothetical protein n=1 Tax=Spirillospora sp. NBC_01491 TaxID=2976007 RepID=UPI002E318220|nr:hypothetical protein [Spirillospora sp. NBC_01491]
MKRSPFRARRCALATAIALAAVPVTAAAAQPAATWTVTPGGALTAAGPARIENAARGWTITCADTRLTGTAKSGAGNTGEQILAVDTVSFGGCTGSDGLAYTVTSESALMEMGATGYDAAAGRTSGGLFGFQVNIVRTDRCQFDVAGSGDLGTADATFTNAGSVLGLGGGDMGVTFVNFACAAGFVAGGDAVVLSAELHATPEQTITSP